MTTVRTLPKGHWSKYYRRFILNLLLRKSSVFSPKRKSEGLIINGHWLPPVKFLEEHTEVIETVSKRAGFWPARRLIIKLKILLVFGTTFILLTMNCDVRTFKPLMCWGVVKAKLLSLTAAESLFHRLRAGFVMRRFPISWQESNHCEVSDR